MQISAITLMAWAGSHQSRVTHRHYEQLLIIWNKTQVADYFVRRFASLGRMWRNSDLHLARQVLNHITEDQGSVGAAKARVDQMMQ